VSVCAGAHKLTKNTPYKTARPNGLPDDQHMTFETCRSRKEF